jgi:hypothetical protein
MEVDQAEVIMAGLTVLLLNPPIVVIKIQIMPNLKVTIVMLDQTMLDPVVRQKNTQTLGLRRKVKLLQEI